VSSKTSIPEWLEEVIKNDQDHGRDGKSNPNNQPNGK
jgi:hypothetical protein